MRYNEITDWQKKPEIAAIVRAAFPAYRRKKVLVQAQNSVTLRDLNWSGGTRSEFIAVQLDGALKLGDTLAFSRMWPGNNYAEGSTVELPEGVAIVRGGYFCGKESLVTITVRPSNVTPALEVA